MNRGHIFLWLALFLLLTVSGVLLLQLKQQNQTAEQISLPKRTLEHSLKQFESKAIIGGVGDILIHETVYEDAYTDKEGYDFDSMFAPAYPLLQKPDFLIANQESVPGGSKLGLSGYPSFNSPSEIIDALLKAGVNMVTTANNHMLDKGEEGLLSAIDHYEKKGMLHTGTFKSPEDKNTLRIQNVNGIKLAVLAYSYGTNGIQIPAEKDYMVSIIDPEKVKSDIDAARNQADIVILALHWGDEYAREPNQRQRALTHQFIEAGADIIFGHHPHVLQPIEWVDKHDGKRGLVVYSLGNFISGQKTKNPHINIGGLIEVSLKKINNETSIEDVNFHPTYCTHTQHTDYQVMPLEQAHKHGFTQQTKNSVKKFMLPK